jgi:long-chain acyl-CoA synthetase
MHRRVAERLGPRPAIRFKRYGLYHDLSWDEYRRQADAAAAALIEMGIGAGDAIGLLGENSVHWLLTDIAILAAGAVDVPLHAPLVGNQVEYQLRHSGARGVFVSRQAQADKVLAALGRLPDLEFLVSFVPVETSGWIRSLTWDGLVQSGRSLRAAGLERVRQREDAVTRDQLATIIYTSGTTGNPKGVMLSHGNLLSNAEAVLATTAMESHDTLLSWLPYSHIYARTVDHYLTILGEGTLALAESSDTVLVNLAETQPQWLTSVPRLYEKVWANVEALPAEQRAKTLHAIFGPQIKRLSSGGAPLPRQVCEGFLAVGLPLLEGYGLTESSPVITFNRNDSFRPGSVGQAIPGVEVKIASDGEILTRGPHVMLGYWKDPEATAAVIDADGWLKTGDVGHLDAEGFLFITDRKKDLMVTSGGKNVAPAELEALLTSDPYIEQAVVHGDRKPFVTALLVPNLPRLQAKADELGAPMQIEDGLVRNPVLHAFLKDRVAQIMQAVSQPERVREFLILSHPFQVEAGELTATMKVRRRYILDKYRTQLEALYANRRESSTDDTDLHR